MARREIAFQPVFVQGMLEGADIDWNSQSTQASCVLLLNYDHLRMEGALVKRDGWRLLYDNATTDDYTLSPHTPGIKTNLTYTVPSSTDLVQLDLGDFCAFWKTYDTDEQNHILGVANARYNESDNANSVILVFARFWKATNLPYIEGSQGGTMVLSYNKEQGQASRRWQSPFVNSYANNAHPYPGWMARGILTDWTRFGGTVIYATELNTVFDPVDTAVYRTGIELPTTTPDVSENMYPVYVWSQVDNGWKRDKGNNHFWYLKKASATTGGTLPFNDLTALYDTDNKYKQTKTRYPSMWLTRNDVVGWREMDDVSDVAFRLMNKSIEVCIGETKGREYSQDRFDWEDRTNVSGVENYYDGAHRRPENYPTISTGVSAWLNVDATFTESLEVLDGINFNIPDEYTEYLEWIDHHPGKWGVRVVTCTYAGKEYRLNILSSPMSQDRKNGVSNVMRAPNEDASPSWDKTGHMVVGVRLPNYLANGNPRYWLKGEKIPFVLTAVVNGTEIKISDYVYEVRTDFYQPNPNLYNIARIGSWIVPFHRWDTLPGTNDQKTIYSRLFYGVYDAQMLSDGSFLYPVPIMFWPDWSRTTDPNSTEIKDIWPKEFIAHCWEPWNPSQAAPYVPAPGEYPINEEPYFYGGVYDLLGLGASARFDRIGHRPYLCEGNIVWVSMRFKNDFLATLYELGVSKFNIYIAKASQDESLLQSLGLFALTKSVPSTYYAKPSVDAWDNNPSAYGLLHSFVLDGKGKPFSGASDAQKWKDIYNGEPTEHQGWQWNETHMYPAPVDENGDFIPVPFGSGATFVTPDFWVWDYATDQPTLTLNSDGQYWQGRSARAVEQVKGRVFIGGCIDEKGTEEPGLVRFSAVQKGVISLDVFNKSDYVQFGASPIVALKEYREQLWVFSRHEMYRLQMPNIADTVTWEILEKVAGQGTFAPMTVVTTPYGVVWANENGLWLSDGRAPQNLAENILVQYQWLSTLRPDPLARVVALPAVPIENGYNPYLSVDYDPVKDEIYVRTPTATPQTAPTTSVDSSPLITDHELRGEITLIFNLPSKTWRMEKMDFPEFGETVSRETELFA